MTQKNLSIALLLTSLITFLLIFVGDYSPLSKQSAEHFKEKAKKVEASDLYYVNLTKGIDTLNQSVLIYSHDNAYSGADLPKEKITSNGKWFIREGYFEVNETDSTTFQNLSADYFNEQKYYELEDVIRKILPMGFVVCFEYNEKYYPIQSERNYLLNLPFNLIDKPLYIAKSVDEPLHRAGLHYGLLVFLFFVLEAVLLYLLYKTRKEQLRRVRASGNQFGYLE